MKQSLVIISILQLFLFSCSKEDSKKIDSIELDTSELTLKIGETYQFKVYHYPQNIQEPDYIWMILASPNSSKIAEIDDKGKLTALSEGEVIVRIVSPVDDNPEYLCKVKIIPVSAENIKLSKNSLNLKIGDSEVLTYSIHPENTTYKDILWESTNEEIVLVEAGKISALRSGKAEIIASLKNTNVKDTCAVIVDPINIEEIILEKPSIELEIGESIQMTYDLLPKNATNKDVSWSVNNDNVSVDESGMVKALKIGQSEVTIKSSVNKDIQAKCIIVVKAKKGGIEFINKNVNIITNSSGYNAPLLSGVTIDRIEWESSNRSVIEINSKGVLKAKSVGSATIKAKIKGTNDFAEYIVNSKPVSELVSITAKGKNIYSTSASSQIIFHSRLNNNSITEVTIYGVLMIDESRNIRQLKNSTSGYIIFDPLVVNGPLTQSYLDYFSSWKVVYQISVGDVDYDLEKNISSKTFGSL